MGVASSLYNLIGYLVLELEVFAPDVETLSRTLTEFDKEFVVDGDGIGGNSGHNTRTSGGGIDGRGGARMVSISR